MATYSLANYIVAFTNIISNTKLKEFTIGGQGSMMDSISVKRTNSLYETKGDPTGGFVHEKSYDKTGTVELTLNQLSEGVSKFITLFNIYANDDSLTEGLEITIRDSLGNDRIKCHNCVPQAIAEQRFEGSTGTQTWTFNSGKIEFL